MMGRGPQAGISRPLRSALGVGHRFPTVVVLFWVLAAAALSLLVTPLGTVVERSSTAFLPEDSPTLQGLRVMDTAFGSGNTQSYVFVVITYRETPDGTFIRPISARYMHAKEIEDYEQNRPR